jgi:phage tail sheath gpL-like
MATLNIQIKVKSADARIYIQKGKHQSLINAAQLLKGLAAGATLATIDMGVSTVDPVASSAICTCASVADADTVTVAGTVLTAKTSPSGSAQWARGVSDTADAAALVACINAHTTVSQYVTAASVAGVVTITANIKGVIGNLITLTSSSNTTLAVTGSGKLASGAGGVVGTQTTFGR